MTKKDRGCVSIAMFLQLVSLLHVNLSLQGMMLREVAVPYLYPGKFPTLQNLSNV